MLRLDLNRQVVIEIEYSSETPIGIEKGVDSAQRRRTAKVWAEREREREREGGGGEGAREGGLRVEGDRDSLG